MGRAGFIGLLLISVVTLGVFRAFADEVSSAAEAAVVSAAADTLATIEKLRNQTIIHLEGEPEAEVQTTQGRSNESGEFTRYVAGRVAVNEALPADYPRPTAPGAIELKYYPQVRLARTTESRQSVGGRGAFMKLFAHISQNDIAMTAPVEMTYPALKSQDLTQLNKEDTEPDAPVMAFLYRTEDLGPTGDSLVPGVEVIDQPAKIVIAVGVRGDMSQRQITEHVAQLRDTLSRHAEWVEAGEPRTLGYNGPYIRRDSRWWEVQIPVKLATEAEMPDEVDTMDEGPEKS